MKNKTYLLNTLLAAVVTTGLLAALLVRVFVPAAVLPVLNIPNLAAISLAALVLEHFLAPGAKRCYICIPVFSAVTFGLLPWAAGFVAGGEVWKYALAGGAVFTAVTWLYSSMLDRNSTGHDSHGAAVVSALGLYLAVQAFAGILL